jgi:hypothetical protein
MQHRDRVLSLLQLMCNAIGAVLGSAENQGAVEIRPLQQSH